MFKVLCWIWDLFHDWDNISFIFTSCPLISSFTCSNAATTNSALECAVYKSRNKFHFRHQTVEFNTFSLVSGLFLASTLFKKELRWRGFCLFVGLWFIVPLEKISLIWKCYHYRWRATNFDLCSALMAIEQWRFLSVPHLLCTGHLRIPVTLTPFADI